MEDYMTYLRELEVMAVGEENFVHIADREHSQVFIVDRKEWIKIQNVYLDTKADYFKQCKYYCGAENIVYKGDVTGPVNLLYIFLDEEYDPDDPEYSEIPHIFVSHIDLEMEHG